MENQPQDICRNCQTPLPPAAKFCPRCGQKNTDGRLTFGELLHEFSGSLLNLDLRIFRTLKALLFPGRLTVEYFKGRHIPYYHPVRLFLVAGALLIAITSIFINENQLSEINSIWETRKTRHVRHEEFLRLDSLRGALRSQFPEPQVGVAFDTLLEQYAKGEDLAGKDSIEIRYALQLGNASDGRKGSDEVAIEDMMRMDEKGIADKYGIEGFWKRLIFMQNIRILKAADKLVFYLIGNVLWMMLIMMPMLAVLLKLLYIRRPFYYYEHLVFSFHTHAFVFLLISLTLLIDKYAGTAISPFAFFALPVYLVIAMKRFYGQGWLKTILKFLIAHTSYLFIFFLALLLTLVACLLLF
ncbi:MAG: DUF3667 domain-containing protein [Saprospiraceae bacterium]|nr:MAG: DUF3667 domain-containing protein [Saprospiraceae bacterium]